MHFIYYFIQAAVNHKEKKKKKQSDYYNLESEVAVYCLKYTTVDHMQLLNPESLHCVIKLSQQAL